MLFWISRLSVSGSIEQVREILRSFSLCRRTPQLSFKTGLAQKPPDRALTRGGGPFFPWAIAIPLLLSYLPFKQQSIKTHPRTQSAVLPLHNCSSASTISSAHHRQSINCHPTNTAVPPAVRIRSKKQGTRYSRPRRSPVNPSRNRRVPTYLPTPHSQHHHQESKHCCGVQQ